KGRARSVQAGPSYKAGRPSIMRQLADSSGIPDIERDMAFMCTTVGTRLAGSPEEERVADYMVGRFRALGLTNPRKLPFSCKRWLPGAAAVQVAPAGP